MPTSSFPDQQLALFRSGDELPLRITVSKSSWKAACSVTRNGQRSSPIRFIMSLPAYACANVCMRLLPSRRLLPLACVATSQHTHVCVCLSTKLKHENERDCLGMAHYLNTVKEQSQRNQAPRLAPPACCQCEMTHLWALPMAAAWKEEKEKRWMSRCCAKKWWSAKNGSVVLKLP